MKKIKFSDLVFEKHYLDLEMLKELPIYKEFKKNNSKLPCQAQIFFKNGYGASVICTPYSYGGTKGLYEVAVLKGGKDEACLTYDTPITDDVLGYLSEQEVEKVLNEIQKLESLSC
jgi:hypothetical protein